MIRRLRSWFGADSGFVSILAGLCLASLATDGPGRPEELAARLLPLLGHGWMTSEGQPLDETLTRSDLYRLEWAMEALDLIRTSRGTWSAGPSALWLLPRATALAHIWSQAPPKA